MNGIYIQLSKIAYEKYNNFKFSSLADCVHIYKKNYFQKRNKTLRNDPELFIIYIMKQSGG